MGLTSAWHWIIVLAVILILFGAGKLPNVMGDLAKGIKNFKSGLKDEDDAKSVTTDAGPTTTTTTTRNDGTAA
jgi:sec-independent protein translocase protein TatA